MKESVKKAYKVIDSSSVYISEIINRYIDTLYNLGYKGDIRISGDSTLKELESELKALIEKLLGEVDSISFKATEEDYSTPSLIWNKTAYVSSVIYGSTFDKRVDEIINRLISEISTHAKTAKSIGLSQNAALSQFKQWIARKQSKKSLEEQLNDAMDKLGGQTSLNRLTYLFDDMINRGYHEANIHYWKQAGIRFKQIVAVVDTHTCNTCMDLDGKIFEVDELVLPVHGYCRCEEHPV